MMITSKIKVNDYGDMFAKIKGLDLISYEEYGSYQGRYIVILKDETTNRLFYYFGSYGSCSGCDWLQSEMDWNTSEVEYKDALDYCNVPPKYIVPADQPLEIKYDENYYNFYLKSNKGKWEEIDD